MGQLNVSLCKHTSLISLFMQNVMHFPTLLWHWILWDTLAPIIIISSIFKFRASFCFILQILYTIRNRVLFQFRYHTGFHAAQTFRLTPQLKLCYFFLFLFVYILLFVQMKVKTLDRSFRFYLIFGFDWNMPLGWKWQ